MAWDAGAITLATLTGDGRFSFVVPSGVANVVVGLNTDDASVRPEEIRHGFQVSSGNYRVAETGSAKTDWIAATGSITFHIVRFRSIVYYCVGTTAEPHDAVPGGLPGSLVYTSSAPPEVPVFLDASLWGIGDEVQDATLHEIDGVLYSTGAAFPPARAAGYASDYSIGSAVSAPLEAVGDGRVFSATNTFLPMFSIGSVGDYAVGSAVSLPMASFGSGSTLDLEMLEIAAVFPAARAYGSGVSAPAPAGEAIFPPMGAAGYSGDVSAGYAVFPSLESSGYSEGGQNTPYFHVVLPAIGEEQDQADYVVEAITFSDEYEIIRGFAAEDTIAFSDSMQWDSELPMWDEILFSDSVEQVTTQFAEDIIDFSDAVEAETGHVFADTIDVSAALEHLSVSAHEIEDAIGFSDAAVLSAVTESEDTITFIDEVEQVASADVEDTIALSDEIEQVAALPGHEVEDVIAFSDATESVRTSTIEIEDVIAVSDAVFQKNPSATAWVLNTESGAASWYSNWQIVDMVQVGDKVLAVGPEGLLLVDAEDDAGALIDASVKYGFMDFGEERKKRVDNFWFGYTSSGELSVAVETYGQGHPPYTYTMPVREADAPRNNRVRPGKGLNARYWRIELQNEGGCAFSVDSMSADVATSSRRL